MRTNTSKSWGKTQQATIQTTQVLVCPERLQPRVSLAGVPSMLEGHEEDSRGAARKH